VCEEHMQWYWSLLTGVSSRFDGRGSGSSPIGMCVWPAATTATSTRVLESHSSLTGRGVGLPQSGCVCLAGLSTATSTRVLESHSSLTGRGVGLPQSGCVCLAGHYRYLYPGTGVSFLFDREGCWPSAIRLCVSGRPGLDVSTVPRGVPSRP
jgi:hypothetical protein